MLTGSLGTVEEDLLLVLVGRAVPEAVNPGSKRAEAHPQERPLRGV